MSTVLLYETKLPILDLNLLPLKDLDQHLQRLVKTERKIMDQVLKAISEIDMRRGYLQLGFGSLFSYLVSFGYSESAAQRRITAARVMQKMNSTNRHKVEQSLNEGSINLTQLGKINSLFDYLEKLEVQGEVIEINTALPKLIQDLQGQNAQKTDAVIAKTLNSALPPEKQKTFKQTKQPKIKNQINGRVKITLDLTSELNKKLQKVLDFKSHAIPDRNVLTLFEKFLDAEIKKIDGPNKTKVKSQDNNHHKDQDGVDPINSLHKDQGEVNPNDSHQRVQDGVMPINSLHKDRDGFEPINSHRRNQNSAKPINDQSRAQVKDISLNLEINLELNPNPLQNPNFTAATNVSPVASAKINPGKTKRKPISIIIKRRVYQKAGHQCEYRSPLTGQRCSETRYLTIDHIQPVINWPI